MKTTFYTTTVLSLLMGGIFFLSSISINCQEMEWADNYDNQVLFASADFSSNPTIESSSIANEESTVRRNEEVRSDFLSLGLNLYDRREWSSAGEVLNKYLENYDRNTVEGTQALYHLALCNLNNSEYHLSVMNFHELSNQVFLNQEMKQEAEYLEALAWFQLNEDEGRKIMSRISGDNHHVYQETATGILKEFE